LQKNFIDIVAKLFLGTIKVVTLYPIDGVTIEAIFASLNISDDTSAHEAFIKEWCKPNGFQ